MSRYIIVFLLATIGLASCTKKDVSQLTDSQKASRIEGSWRITLFTEKNGSEMHDFSGYTFDFAKDGSFNSTVSGQGYEGTFTFGKDDGLDRIFVSISGTSDLDELTDDWVLNKLESKNMIWLDDSGSERVEWQKQ